MMYEYLLLEQDSELFQSSFTLAQSENAFAFHVPRSAFCPSRQFIDRKNMEASMKLTRPTLLHINYSSLRRISEIFGRANFTPMRTYL